MAVTFVISGMLWEAFNALETDGLCRQLGCELLRGAEAAGADYVY